LAGHDPQARDAGVLLRALEEDLQAHADAGARPPRRDVLELQRLAAARPEHRRDLAEAPLPGQDEALGARGLPRVGRDQRRQPREAGIPEHRRDRAEAPLAGQDEAHGALGLAGVGRDHGRQPGERERPGDAVDVAGAVVDDGGAHLRLRHQSKPFVEGRSPWVTRGAAARARAKAFITASQTWWVSSPARTRTCTVAPAWFAKPLRSSRRWKALKPPGSPAKPRGSNARYGRPERSITACARVSSIGTKA